MQPSTALAAARRNAGPLVLLGVAILTAFLLSATAPKSVPAFAAVRAGASSDSRLLDRFGRIVDERRTDDRVRRLGWVSARQVSPALIAAILAAEDRHFHEHGGVDWRAVAGSLRDRLTGRRGVVRGASTLSMQVAGLLQLDRHARGRRTPLDKLRQMRAALALERAWSKTQILEAYLNLASFRGDLVGIAAASRALAGKSPDGLGAPESLVLASLLPSPSASPDQVARRACRLSQTMGPAAPHCLQLQLAAAELLAGGRRAATVAHLAPQLAAALLTRPATDVRTTLDRDVQAMVSAALTTRLADLGDRNTRDGAALVIDNATGDILAWVGSAGGRSTAGEVDGVRAPRQAGSTLKPFLYALAIDRRYLTAASILQDAPVDLDTASGLYVPENYDRTFRGPVSVRTALGNSLNVPAVRTLLVTGVEPFRDFLNEAGYPGINAEGDHYGYSLALGSAEVTLLEQAAAYRMLARGGIAGPLRLTASGVRSPGRRVMSAAAASIISDILADGSARTSTFGIDHGLQLPFWAAVKTGTSKAMRDNWCIGFSRRFTVAVWVGNFEGDSMAGVSGASGAAPAWRDIMLWLHRDGAPAAPIVPGGVETRPLRFEPAIEPPRSEHFVVGTSFSVAVAKPERDLRPRLIAPANGAIVALDPDIPLARQSILIRTSGAGALSLSIDGHRLPLRSGNAIWRPVPGSHRIVLADDGRLVDAARVTVR